MTTCIYGDTTLDGYGLNIEEDLRVLRNIERQAKILQAKMDKLNVRWDARAEKMQKRRSHGIRTNFYFAYSFQDCLA